MFTGSEDRRRSSSYLGSTGCQPVVCGSLPQTMISLALNVPARFPFALRAKLHSARRPNAAGWQPALPRGIGARAFTLLEIMLAVIILGMMSLAIYRFVQANVTAMRVSSEVDAVEARYDGLRELLTQHLQSLPPGAGALAGEPLKIEGHDRDELSWFCSAGPGVLTRYANGDYRVSLRLRRHDAKSQQLDLGLLRKPKDDTAGFYEKENWVGLVDKSPTFANCLF